MAEYRKFVTLCTEALDINSVQLTGEKNGADLIYHESLKNGLVQIRTELSDMGVNFDPIDSVPNSRPRSYD